MSGWNQLVARIVRNWRAFIDVATSIALLGAVAVVILPRIRSELPPSPPPSGASELLVPAEPVQLTAAAAIGSNEATYALIEFSDFQCPFCGRFARETLPTLRREFVDKGTLLFVFRHLPLSIHSLASGAAAASACAERQGRFWPLHDALFQPQAALEPAAIRSLAAELDLNVDKFDSCLTAEGPIDVSADVTTATALGIKGTPAFLVNGRFYSGSRPYAEIQKVVEDELQRAAAKQ